MPESSKAKRRAKGEGAVYTTSDGRLRGSLLVGDPITGRRVRRWVTGKSRAEIARKFDDLRKDAAAGVTGDKTTVEKFLAGWLERERPRIRASTWVERELHCRRYIIPAIGKTALARLTPRDVEAMTTGLAGSGLSNRTAAHVRVTLRRALADAERDGLVPRNVASLARPPHVEARAIEAGVDYLEPADLRRLMTAAKVHQFGPLVTLAATTGLRLGELLGLAWSDVDRDAATLTVRRSLARSWDGPSLTWALREPKTKGSRRTVNLPAAAVAALDRQRALQAAARDAAGRAWQDRDGLVFTDSIGRTLRGDEVNHVWHRMLDAAKLPSIPFHGLRHSFATASLAGGVSLRTVADALGHSTIVITSDIYGHVTAEARREAALAIDRALAED